MEKSQKQLREEIRELETEVKTLAVQIGLSYYTERAGMYRKWRELQAQLRDLKEQVKH